jgi:hypothetical protein
LRDRIEQCASRKFDAGEFEGKPPGIVLRCIDFRKLALLLGLLKATAVAAMAGRLASASASPGTAYRWR